MTTWTDELRSEKQAYGQEESELESLYDARECRLQAAGIMEPDPLFQVTTEPATTRDFVTVDSDGGLPTIHLHERQAQLWESTARFVAAVAGSQAGKTALGPWWLLREMRDKGPGNYLLVAPTFRLLDKQAVPTLQRALETILGLGHLIGGGSGEFRISEEGHARIWPAIHYEPTRIVFGYAENPDSLESLTAKAAWCDEAGQAGFKATSHEAIQARLAIHQGRILYTSSPYVHHWFKHEVYDRAERNRIADRDGLPRNPADAGYDAVSYESRMNPVFSQAEWDRQKLILPKWRFDMRYRGLFTRPAGAIYDCFDPDFHVLPGGYEPETNWRIYCGIDFGAPNFRAKFVAEEPGTKKRVVFAEYCPKESRKAADHIAAMHAVMRKAFRNQAGTWAAMSGRPVTEWTRLPEVCVGGAKSEGQWRTEFGALGWPIKEPDQPSVEVGISRVYAAFAEDRLFITEDCPELLADVQDYSREVDDDGNPVSDTIEDKDDYHSGDALRYIVSWLEAKGGGFFAKVYD